MQLLLSPTRDALKEGGGCCIYLLQMFYTETNVQKKRKQEVFKLFLICPLFQKALLYFEIYSLEPSADPPASTQNADLAEFCRHTPDKFFL